MNDYELLRRELGIDGVLEELRGRRVCLKDQKLRFLLGNELKDIGRGYGGCFLGAGELVEARRKMRGRLEKVYDGLVGILARSEVVVRVLDADERFFQVVRVWPVGRVCRDLRGLDLCEGELKRVAEVEEGLERLRGVWVDGVEDRVLGEDDVREMDALVRGWWEELRGMQVKVLKEMAEGAERRVDRCVSGALVPALAVSGVGGLMCLVFGVGVFLGWFDVVVGGQVFLWGGAGFLLCFIFCCEGYCALKNRGRR